MQTPPSDTGIRIPPSSIESEAAVLGALMLSPDALGTLSLTADDFYRRDHRHIFLAIQALAETGRPYDAVTVGEWLHSHVPREEVSDDYVVELASTTPSAANIGAYAAIVREKSSRRRLIAIGTALVNDGFNCKEPADTISHAMCGLATESATVSDQAREPLDLFGDQPLPTLDPAWLPPGVARYAWDQADIIGTAPEMIAFSCLGTIAAATHDDIVVKVKANERWTERACLWLMVVAEPGSKKSAAMKNPMKPLRKIEAALHQENDGKAAEFIKADKVFQLRQKAAIKREAAGDAGLDAPEDGPQRPAQRRVIVSDITTEKLGDLLLDNPRGLLLYQDEIVVWFGSHDAYSKNGGGKDRGIAIQAYEGGPYPIDRVGRGTQLVPNLSYSLMGSTQPQKIRAMTAKMTDDGLLQRFMVVEVAGKARQGDEEREEVAAYREEWERAIETIWSRQPQQGERCVVTLSKEADAIRREFFTWAAAIANAEGLPEMLRSHVSKWEGLWPRLALTYHSYGTAVAGQWPSNLPISASTARRVTQLMKHYLLPQALRFYADTASRQDGVYGIAAKVAEMVLAKGLMRVTNRELQHGVNTWRGAQEWQKTAVVTMLRESGWFMGVGESKRASGAESGWTINPRVHVLFAERAAIAAARRAETAETLKALRDAAAGSP